MINLASKHNTNNEKALPVNQFAACVVKAQYMPMYGRLSLAPRGRRGHWFCEKLSGLSPNLHSGGMLAQGAISDAKDNKR